jgi:anti-sigma regulatory factor (Ser/Thr protein kinase)
VRVRSPDYFSDWNAPKQARGFCTDHLTDALGYGHAAQAVIDDTNLVVSELITNAVSAGGSELQFELDVHHGRLRVTVRDHAPGSPQPRDAKPTDEGGRGLQLVAQLSTSWGVEYPGEGKKVWAEIAVPCELTTALLCAI